MALSFTDHWIEFANPSPVGLVEWVHIAEAKFYIYRLKFSSLIFINWYHLLFNNGNTLNPPIHHQCPSSGDSGPPVAASCGWCAVPSVCPESQGQGREGGHQEIAMKTNRAYCQVTRGGGGRTPYSNGEVKEAWKALRGL